jgi:hypothetical protein
VTTPSFPTAPLTGTDEREHRRKIAQAANLALGGKLNCTGMATLTPGAGSTTITDARVSANSVILLSPLTAHAAAELSAGTLYMSARAAGSFTIQHANNAQNDRSFGYAIIG